jgi:hypothetical protein
MDYQVVHIRINDAATGKPTPVRLRLCHDGRYLPPLGRANRIPVAWGESVGGSLRVTGGAYAYVDGACEARLPAGAIHVQASKGPEYAPLSGTEELRVGQLAMRLRIEQRFNLTAEGWYAGDTNAQFLTPHAAALEGAAEGLHVVNLLAFESHLPSLLEFSGQEPAHARYGCMVAVNTLNDGGEHGRLALLHCHRIVFPLTLTAAGFEKYTLADWCQQCHRKKGLVVWPYFPEYRGNVLANLQRGEIDAVEWTSTAMPTFASEGLPEWYRLLNLGFRIPLVGGSGKGSNAVPLGAVRTYAQLESGKEFTYGHWIEAVRLGRTFATRGPLMQLSVNGKGPGGTLTLDNPDGPLNVNIEAFAVAQFEPVELIVDGEVIGEAFANESQLAQLTATVSIANARWVAARCWGPDGLAAHTSPIYLAGANRKPDAVEQRLS